MLRAIFYSIPAFFFLAMSATFALGVIIALSYSQFWLAAMAALPFFITLVKGLSFIGKAMEDSYSQPTEATPASIGAAVAAGLTGVDIDSNS